LITDSGLSHELLGVAFGMIVGVSLSLTGGGGSIFAKKPLSLFAPLKKAYE
jgi:uncharacterized membrane protein YfcA